ncbi:MAG TPA: class I SAM-dependent methyltransferase [Dehalococcoidia bacterium]|nr:class I SAM-dependent methyltransferase [Dehalococcoidia bacterium]
MKPFSKNMFEDELAKYYDIMRQYRDYDRECSFIDNLIKRDIPTAKRGLDICCGTGEHAIRMARFGYEVTGVDQSQDMLAIAVDKATKSGLPIDFICRDIFGLGIKEKFEVAYCLGYTFLYMTTDPDVRRFFKAIRDALLPGGLFLFDFINGISLSKDFDKDEFTYQHEDATIRQHDKWSLDKKRGVKHLDFEYEITDSEGRVHRISAEEDVRIFYDDEVQNLLSSCGFSDVESFGDYALERNGADDPYIVIISGKKM